MTRARDLADLISSGSIESSEITSIDASKLSGTIASARLNLGDSDIPNLAASKITSGTFADARIAASNVSQHATSFDDNKIVNDISTLAIRQASNENKSAYNTNSMYVDVFQDDTGIASNTNAPRNSGEFVSTVVDNMPTGTQLYLKSNSASNNSTSLADHSGNNVSISFGGGGKHITQGDVPIGAVSGTASTSAFWFDGGGQKIDASHSAMETPINFGTGDFTLATYWRTNNGTSDTSFMNMGGIGSVTDYNGWSWDYRGNVEKMTFYLRLGGSNLMSESSTALTIQNDTWYHLAVTRESGTLKFWKNGVLHGSTGSTHDINMANADSRPFNIGIKSDGTHNFAGRMDAMHIIKGSALYTSNFTPPTVYYGTTANATGNFISNAITAPSSTSKMGAIITYQDNAGTNTLNTDIVLQLSADNGSNFTTATLTALPDFSTGIKMAKVNDLSVTAGTQLKYKISFANQASGSKEARIRGVSLQY